MTKKRRNWLIVIILAVVIGGIILASSRKPKIEYTTAPVTKGTLVQSVNETGTITPAKEIELNFLNTGQLTQIKVAVGDKVMPQQPLGQVDSSGLAIKEQEASANLNVSLANVTQAQSNLDSARREYTTLHTSLDETVRQAEKTQRDLEDTSTSTITTYDQALITAQANLVATKSTYQRAIDNKAASLGTTLDNKIAAATTSLDDINRILSDDEARPTLSAKNSAALTQARASYESGRTLVATANTDLALYHGNGNFLDNAQRSSTLALNKVFEALNGMMSVLVNTVPSGNFTQTDIDAYKTMIDAELSTTSTAVTSVQSAKQAWDDAKLSYETNVLTAEQSISQAQANYDAALRTARNATVNAKTNRDQQLASAQTRVNSAEANLVIAQAQIGQAQSNLELVRNQLKDTTLVSPIEGVITKVNYQVGEQVSPQKAFVSVLTENNYQLELDIAETDITKIKQNNEAKITLDSLGEAKEFTGAVYFIEPAATVIQGVTYYKIKISFDPGTEAVKPGMTASAVITTARLDNVLMMPARAVVERDGKKYVRILENNTPREAVVVTGLNGDDGLVEVKEGVNENDQVVTFIKDPSKK